jgi:hypothetical protein
VIATADFVIKKQQNAKSCLVKVGNMLMTENANLKQESVIWMKIAQEIQFVTQ